MRRAERREGMEEEEDIQDGERTKREGEKRVERKKEKKKEELRA